MSSGNYIFYATLNIKGNIIPYIENDMTRLRNLNELD